MEKSLEEQAAVERGPIPPLKSSSGQQKAGEDGVFVLLRRAWFDLNISYKKEEDGQPGGSVSTISAIRDNPADLNRSTWLDGDWQMQKSHNTMSSFSVCLLLEA